MTANETPLSARAQRLRRASGAPAPAAEHVGARITRNVMALGVSQVFTWISAAVLAVMLPRYLGDDYLGKLVFAQAFTVFFGLGARLGMETYLTKEVARDRSTALDYTFNAIAMRLPLLVVASVAAIGTMHLIGADTLTMRTVYIMTLAMAAEAIYGILVACAQGLEEMRWVARAQVLGKFVQAAVIAGLLISGYGLLWVALAWSLFGVVGILVTGFFVVRAVGVRGHLNRSMAHGLVIGGLPFVLWQASLMIYGQIDIVMLSLFTTDAVTGWYGAAYRIITVPVFIPGALMAALLPPMVAAARDGTGRFQAIARRGTQAVLVSTIPMAAGMMLLSRQIVDLLGYAPEFDHSVPLIIILAIHIPMLSTGMIVGTALYAMDKQRAWALVGLSAAVLNPVLNLPMIPLTQDWWGNGAIGASIATVTTEFFMLAMGLRLLGVGVLGRPSFDVAVRSLAACAIMAAVVWPIRDVNIFLAAGAGAAVYCGASFALGTVRIADIRLLRTYLLSRTGVVTAEAP